jgi:hypothetical protein
MPENTIFNSTDKGTLWIAVVVAGVWGCVRLRGHL